MKRLIGVFLVLVLALSMFAGCTQEKEVAEPVNDTQTEAAKVPTAKPEEPEEPKQKVDSIKVTSGLWSDPVEQQFIREEVLPEFEEETGIKVELEVIDNIDKVMMSQKESGKWTSDVLMTHSGTMPSYIENEFVKPLDDLIGGLDITVLEAFNQSTKMNGKTYYIPISADVYLLVANNKALDYLPDGATIETLTWEQYKDWAVAMAKGEGDAKVTIPAEPIKAIVYQMGGVGLSYGAGFPEINTDGMKSTWALIGEMMAEGAILDTSFNYNNPVDQMKSEEAWLSFYHMVQVGDIYSSAPAQFVVGPAPAGTVGNGTIAGAWGVGITAGTDKAQAAEQFIRFLTRKDILYKISAGTGGFIPPVEEVISELGNEPKDIVIKKGLETLNNGIASGVPASNYQDWGAVKTVYDEVFKKLYDDNGVVDEAFLDEQQAALEALLK